MNRLLELATAAAVGVVEQLAAESVLAVVVFLVHTDDGPKARVARPDNLTADDTRRVLAAAARHLEGKGVPQS